MTKPTSVDPDAFDPNRPPGAESKSGAPGDGRDEPYEEEPEQPDVAPFKSKLVAPQERFGLPRFVRFHWRTSGINQPIARGILVFFSDFFCSFRRNLFSVLLLNSDIVGWQVSWVNR
jgi:hypothetical protein